MGYKSSPFKMAPKSPLAKALKGNQHKLPQHLQDAIKAAPESPAKKKGPKPKGKPKTAKQAGKEFADRAMREATRRREAQLNQPKSPAKLDDPVKTKKSKEELRKEKEAKASAFMDSLKEKRAKKAEKSGDKGRAQRIRSSKNRQDGLK